MTGAPAELVGDARSLRHLLRNQLEDARRHAPGAIELAVAPRGGGALVTVADRGPGIAEADRERIFEPFAKGAGEVRGRGSGPEVRLSDGQIRPAG